MRAGDPRAEITDHLRTAWTRRQDLVERLVAEETDAYRLFHGATEGRPGLTVDRYGPLVLVQSFYDTLCASDLEAIRAFYGESFEAEVVYNDRSAKGSPSSSSREPREFSCRESGIRFHVYPDSVGDDPGLFLDMRGARRRIREQAADRTVLNLFAYTGSLGIAAAVGGARSVTHVDFSSTHLDIARRNCALNELLPSLSEFIVSDAFPAVRQLAGLPVKPRAVRDPRTRKRTFLMPDYPELSPRSFDLVLLDPPPWSKSIYGTVDLVNDYQSVFKPALLCVESGGTILCTNNVARVSSDDWRRVLFRCAEKAGRPIREAEFLAPGEDFPSPDGNPPLKIALLRV